ncbi:peptide deformylase [Candidatus Falkowbacteria bacterium]|nr:MAG: peptide deformylase [Candidatus Falkowbacteria bacterium]
MPKLLKIFINPDPVLRKKSEKITLDYIKSKAFSNLAADMTLTMEKKDGVGLAAPQIGKNIRLIVVNTKNGPISLINPKITKKSLLKEWGEEGCLSVPNAYGEVKRHKKISCEYIDINKNKKTIEAQGLMARIIQHEINHLDGILFIDKARNIKEIKL